MPSPPAGNKHGAHVLAPANVNKSLATDCCPLLELTAELRNTIWELVFTSNHAKDELVDLQPSAGPAKDLLCTNKQIYHEAKGFHKDAHRNFWRTTKFALHFPSDVKPKLPAIFDDDLDQVTSLSIKYFIHRPRQFWNVNNISYDREPCMGEITLVSGGGWRLHANGHDIMVLHCQCYDGSDIGQVIHPTGPIGPWGWPEQIQSAREHLQRAADRDGEVCNYDFPMSTQIRWFFYTYT